MKSNLIILYFYSYLQIDISTDIEFTIKLKFYTMYLFSLKFWGSKLTSNIIDFYEDC